MPMCHSVCFYSIQYLEIVRVRALLRLLRCPSRNFYSAHPMIIRWLLRWRLFKIDALGLVTILGTDEVNRFIGRLSRSRLTEYLPLVSSFVIASDGIKSAIPGFELYNVSDGICASDFAGWFSRWLLSQDLTYNCTTLTINIRQPIIKSCDGFKLAAGIGSAICFFIILMPAIMADWWGLQTRSRWECPSWFDR